MEKVIVPVSLKEYAQFRIVSEMLEHVKKNSETPLEMYPLIVDDVSLSIFSSIFTLKDLPDLKISRVEKLKLTRKTMPNSEGIYFITPTEKSINKLLEDFKEVAKPQFARVHLCFLNLTSDFFIAQIANSNLACRVKTFLDVNLEMQCIEDNVFAFNRAINMKILNNACSELNKYISETTNQLFTVCTTLYEHPFIYYYNKSPVCKSIAHALDSKLVDFDHKATFKKHTPRGQLIIVDRSIDMSSCLMHDYSFMSIVYDMNITKNLRLVQIDGGKEEIPLEPSNELWESEKYSHIYDANLKFLTDAEKFTTKNKKMSIKPGQEMDESQLSDMIKRMPEYQNVTKKLPKMMKLTNISTKLFGLRNIAGLIGIEQSIINGIDDKKVVVPPKKIYSFFKDLRKTYEQITDEEVVRLIIILLSKYNLSPKELSTIEELIGEEKWRQCLQNALNLRLVVNSEASEIKRKDNCNVTKMEMDLYEEKLKKLNQRANLMSVPTITKIIYGATEKKYDSFLSYAGKDENEGLKALPQRSNIISKTRPALKKREAEVKDDSEKIILFMVGPLSTHEIAYTFNLQKLGLLRSNVILGANSVGTPKEILESVIKSSMADVNMEEVKIDI